MNFILLCTTHTRFELPKLAGVSLSALIDVQSNRAAPVQKKRTIAAKPSVENRQTAWQELQSFRREQGNASAVEMSPTRFSRELMHASPQ